MWMFANSPWGTNATAPPVEQQIESSSKELLAKLNQIVFKVNGEEHRVGADVTPDTSLNNYLRKRLNLRGTKAMCHEGGCGVCVVAVRTTDSVTLEENVIAVNSCLVSVLSCHNWDIVTVEGVGNKKDGYHQIQSRLAGFNGTQCGLCSPGWVMSMYSLFESNKHNLSMKEIENSFASNLCRCTGYRSILDSFKSLAVDADIKLLERLTDIEDLTTMNLCAKTGSICTKSCTDYDHDKGWCKINIERAMGPLDIPKDIIKINLKNHKWYKVFTVADIYKVFKTEGTDSYRLIAGNTGRGVYKFDVFPRILIDIASVDELKGHTIDVNLVLGGGMTLSEMMTLFTSLSLSNYEFSYLETLVKHLDLVAHYPVRNIGTIAGNLSLKHQNKEFQSDLFLLFETIGATMIIASEKKTTEVSLPKFLKKNMTGKLISKILLPPMSEEYLLKTFKIMPRAQNAHAQVNAGFLFKCDSSKERIQKATIVYGGISADFIHAVATEKVLEGRSLFDDNTLHVALHTLDGEVNPVASPPEPSPKFRKMLALNLFYKAVLSLCPDDKVNKRYKSGGEVFDRPVTQAMQKFDTDESIWPLNKPIPKLEALVQCSGEGAYAEDIPTIHNEVFASFVLAPEARGTLGNIDASEALKLDGVIACYNAKDIPGMNTFMPGMEVEEVLCSGKIIHHSQPVAIIVATSEKLANRAAKLVKVTITSTKGERPVLTIKDALKSKDKDSRVTKNNTQEPTEKGSHPSTVIYGSYELPGQYHFTMETQCCVVVPNEDGLDVYSATQWMDLTQAAIYATLGLPMNKINVHVRRLGGGYGAKISRSGQTAAACALVAKLLNRPCRFILPLETNMMAIGKRLPLLANYEVGVDKDGEIQYLKNTFYQDNGSSNNESIAPSTFKTFINCYDTKRWFIEANSVLTDNPSNTWCRAPATCEGIAMIEHIMDRIAFSLKKDHVDVRLRNMTKTDNPLPDLINQLKKDAEYDIRLAKIKIFNDANRWKKRSIRLIPMNYGLEYFGNFAAVINLYHADGSVTVTHGGIEMGQGINTKVAQVCAHILDIPLEKVTVKPSNSLSTPNAMVSGGSIASESVCFAAMKACEELLARLKPAKASLENPTWEQVASKAYMMGINMQTSYMFVAALEPEVDNYNIFGVTILEVELDILTGNHQVLRVDILEDTGQSMNPTIDVGQVEGAFVMGLGYWTTENLVYDPKTGELLTNRTWNYKLPGAKDIPIDMRVYFRRNSTNPVGVLRSKATGEPPLCMSAVVTHALREALMAAVYECAHTEEVWYDIGIPYTNENIVLASQIKLDDLKLK